MSLDGLPPAHLRVLLDGLPVFERYGLLAGGYAFRAHEIVHRPSQDLDFATRDDTPLPEIAAQVQAAFQHAGYGVRLAEAASPRYARLILRLPGSGEELEMDLLKEALRGRSQIRVLVRTHPARPRTSPARPGPARQQLAAMSASPARYSGPAAPMQRDRRDQDRTDRDRPDGHLHAPPRGRSSCLTAI